MDKLLFDIRLATLVSFGSYKMILCQNCKGNKFFAHSETSKSVIKTVVKTITNLFPVFCQQLLQLNETVIFLESGVKR